VQFADTHIQCERDAHQTRTAVCFGWCTHGRSSSAFQMTTLAAMLNDFGGWTLIAWQPAFYERVHHLPVEVC
jgi:hypothetical protein